MVYKHKSSESIQEHTFDCIETLIEDIIEQFHLLRRYEYISIHVDKETAKKIHNELVFYIDDFNELYFNKESDWSLLYEKEEIELILSIAWDGSFSIESAYYNDGRYKNDCPTFLYFYEYLKQANLEELSKQDVSILVFGVNDEEDDKCDPCNHCHCRHEEDLDEDDEDFEDEDYLAVQICGYDDDGEEILKRLFIFINT